MQARGGEGRQMKHRVLRPIGFDDGQTRNAYQPVQQAEREQWLALYLRSWGNVIRFGQDDPGFCRVMKPIGKGK